MSGPQSSRGQAQKSLEVPDAVAHYLEVMETVPGWFYPLDARVFTAVDALQKAHGITGDILEIGAYRGKSAILLGMLTRYEERLTVCDLFADTSEVTEENLVESHTYYDGLQRDEFESQYLRFHRELPDILAMDSTRIDREALAGSCRIIHVDGSHTYAIVREDIATSRSLLCPGGVVILDDWLQPHAPGVQLALWEEFLRGELIPLCATKFKFYATWDPSGLSPTELDDWAASSPHVDISAPHELAGRKVRTYEPTPLPAPATNPSPKLPPPARVASSRITAVQGRHDAGGSPVRRVARQIVPPIVLGGYRRLRKRLRSK